MNELDDLRKQLLLKQIYENKPIGPSGFISGNQIIPTDEDSEIDLAISMSPSDAKAIALSNKENDKYLYDTASSQGNYLKKLMNLGIVDEYSDDVTRDLYENAKNPQDRKKVLMQYIELSDQIKKQRDNNFGKL